MSLENYTRVNLSGSYFEYVKFVLVFSFFSIVSLRLLLPPCIVGYVPLLFSDVPSPGGHGTIAFFTAEQIPNSSLITDAFDVTISDGKNEVCCGTFRIYRIKQHKLFMFELQLYII